MGMRLLAEDDANRADGAIGANWTTGFGATAPFVIKGGQFSTGAATASVASVYTAVSFPADQWSQVQLRQMNSTTWAGAVVRHAPAANTYYAGGFNALDFGGSTDIRIWKNVAGARTGLAVLAGVPMTLFSTYRIGVQGTTIKLFENGIEILSAVDATISAAGAPGMIGRATAAPDSMQWDNFQAGDFLGLSKIVGPNFRTVGPGGLVS